MEKDTELKNNIWSEEEAETRRIENMLSSEGKNCGNCHWGAGGDNDEFLTCGYHIDNFKSCSFCTYWTDAEDPKLIAYRERRIKEMRNKIEQKRKQDNCNHNWETISERFSIHRCTKCDKQECD